MHCEIDLSLCRSKYAIYWPCTNTKVFSSNMFWQVLKITSWILVSTIYYNTIHMLAEFAYIRIENLYISLCNIWIHMFFFLFSWFNSVTFCDLNVYNFHCYEAGHNVSRRVDNGEWRFSQTVFAFVLFQWNVAYLRIHKIARTHTIYIGILYRIHILFAYYVCVCIVTVAIVSSCCYACSHMWICARNFN